MKFRSVFTALTAATTLVIGGAASASANVVWCTADPPSHVDTAGGENLTVNTSVTVLKPEAKFLNDVTTDAEASAEAGGTLVTVYVYLPSGISNAQVVSSNNKYRVSATGYGTGGTTVTLYLHLPVD